MKLIIITIAMLGTLGTNPNVGNSNEVDQMVDQLIAYYGWEEELVLELDEPTIVEVYDLQGNMLLRSEDIDADVRLLDGAQLLTYRNAEFVMQSGDTKIYMAN